MSRAGPEGAAAGCQRRIVSAIRARGADYVIGLKGNQPTMLDEVSLLFEDALRANPSAFRSHTTPATRAV